MVRLVILPAALAVVALGASRVFDYLHPVPVNPLHGAETRVLDPSALEERVRAAHAATEEAIKETMRRLDDEAQKRARSYLESADLALRQRR